MAAKPKPPPKVYVAPDNVAVPQEVFFNPASDLAAQLGWAGEPDWVQYDITVADARNYLVKVMHEHHQAAARGLPQPSYEAACKHLHVDTVAEQKAIDEALKLAFASGKDKVFIEANRVVAPISASLKVGAATALGAYIKG